MKRLLCITLCLFCLLCCCACGASVQENAPWPKNEWTKELPPFADVVDALYDNSKDGNCDIVVSMKEVSYQAFCDYVAQVEAEGYIDEYNGQLMPEKEPKTYASFISGNRGICVQINWYADSYSARPLCDMQIQIQTLPEE